VPRLLTASPASGRSLSEGAVVQYAGFFPGSTTFAGSLGTDPGATTYPPFYPAQSLYPGKGSALINNTITPRALSEVAA
jgi:hypothetical protein